MRRVSSLFPALVAAHVLANMIWIGALLAEVPGCLLAQGGVFGSQSGDLLVCRVEAGSQ